MTIFICLFFQMEAAGGGHVEVTQVLLDHGAGVNTQSKDSMNSNLMKEQKLREEKAEISRVLQRNTYFSNVV